MQTFTKTPIVKHSGGIQTRYYTSGLVQTNKTNNSALPQLQQSDSQG